ncbi:MAG TPA: hypothetical protein VNF26_14375 [Candidatus Baltobacterales bacterium]|nr:hypothetical protein [Candidatus Baltobacterales bacterium]
MNVEPPQPPPVSPDGRFWWDGRAWQAMPTLSPDGRHWWDGQSWQPVPLVEEAAAPPPELGFEGPGLSAVEETGAYGPSSTPFVGPPAGYAPPDIANAAPAAYGPPANYEMASSVYGVPAAAVTPNWELEPARQRNRRNIVGDVVLWAGIVLGLLIVMFGGIDVIQLRSARLLPTDEAAAGATIGIALIIIGALVMLGCGMRLMGLTMLGLFRPVLSELAIFGTLMLLSLIFSDVFILATPPGTLPFYFPLTAVVTMLYKFWRGKWLAGGALGFFSLLSVLLQLPSAVG